MQGDVVSTNVVVVRLFTNGSPPTSPFCISCASRNLRCLDRQILVGVEDDRYIFANSRSLMYLNVCESKLPMLGEVLREYST